MTRTIFFRFVRFFCAVSCLGSAAAQVNVTTYHNNNFRTGQNLKETVLKPSNVNSTTFGKLFAYEVDGHVYAQPLYLADLKIPGQGSHNVVFVATQHNSVYAFDADSNGGSNGGLLWHVNFGPSATTPNPDFGNRYGGFSEIVPEVGITGTPVIDEDSGTLYVDAFTHEGTEYFHRIHALDVTTGEERSFSPITVEASIAATGAGSTNGVLSFVARQQLQRCALTLANGILYVAFAGYADTNPYHGWLLGYDASTLKLLPKYIFSSTPNSTVAEFGEDAGEGGIWMAGGGPSVDANNNLYLAIGNGSFNAFNGSEGTEFGNSFVKLSSRGGLSVVDYFTPHDQEILAQKDLDLGSGGLLLLPDQAGSPRHLMVGGGKTGLIYLLNRDRFTAGDNHYNPNGDDAVMQIVSLGGGCFDTPAYFNGNLYFAGMKDALRSFSISGGKLTTNSAGKRVFPYPGATPSISANQNSDGIVWAVARANPAVLVACDASDITTELYSSDQTGGRDQLANGVKFAVPTVANGKVYVGGQASLAVFGLLPVVTPPPPTANFPQASYNGLFFETAPQMESSGVFTATTSKKGTYSGTLQFGPGRLSFRGQFDDSGASIVTLPRRGKNSLTLTLQMNLEDYQQISGTISDGNWQSDLIAHRAVFNSRSNPFPAAGRYTLTLPSFMNGDPQIPQGDGFGTITVNTAGLVKFQGSLADGTAITESALLGENGDWPFYQSLYKNQGVLVGWLSFTGVDGAPEGTLNWIKPPSSSGIYRDGFNLSIAVNGSSYHPPASKNMIENFAEGLAVFTGGNLSEDLTSQITFGARGKMTATDGLKLKFTASSGIFQGTIPDSETRKQIRFSGVMLQDRNAGSGYFLRQNQSGRVTIDPW